MGQVGSMLNSGLIHLVEAATLIVRSKNYVTS